jgi:nitroreductase
VTGQFGPGKKQTHNQGPDSPEYPKGDAMPDFYEVLKSRRSVRAYTAEPVSESLLQELIDLAVMAPNGINLQPWRFVVITEKGLLAELNTVILQLLRQAEMPAAAKFESLKETISQPDFNVFYRAPALILILGDRQVPTAAIDCQLAAENLFLAAQAKGLGSCYMGFLLMQREDPQIRQLLNLPPDYELMAAAVVGFPASPGEGKTERDLPRVDWRQ